MLNSLEPDIVKNCAYRVISWPCNARQALKYHQGTRVFKWGEHLELIMKKTKWPDDVREKHGGMLLMTLNGQEQQEEQQATRPCGQTNSLDDNDDDRLEGAGVIRPERATFTIATILIGDACPGSQRRCREKHTCPFHFLPASRLDPPTWNEWNQVWQKSSAPSLHFFFSLSPLLFPRRRDEGLTKESSSSGRGEKCYNRRTKRSRESFLSIHFLPWSLAWLIQRVPQLLWDSGQRSLTIVRPFKLTTVKLSMDENFAIYTGPASMNIKELHIPLPDFNQDFFSWKKKHEILPSRFRLSSRLSDFSAIIVSLIWCSGRWKRA